MLPFHTERTHERFSSYNSTPSEGDWSVIKMTRLLGGYRIDRSAHEDDLGRGGMSSGEGHRMSTELCSRAEGDMV